MDVGLGGDLLVDVGLSGDVLVDVSLSSDVLMHIGLSNGVQVGVGYRWVIGGSIDSTNDSSGSGVVGNGLSSIGHGGSGGVAVSVGVGVAANNSSREDCSTGG